MKRTIIGLAVGLAVFRAGIAMAAGAEPHTGRLGGGNLAVSSCDSTGVAAGYVVSATETVTAVTVDGIAPNCEGGAVSVTLANGAGTTIGTGGPVTIPASGNSAADSVTV